MNFIDFMAILPVFLTMILEGLEDMRVGINNILIQEFTLILNSLDYW